MPPLRSSPPKPDAQAAEQRAAESTRAGKAQLDLKQTELDQRAAELDQRAAAVGQQEQAAVRAQLAGGTYRAGVDIDPGTYQTNSLGA